MGINPSLRDIAGFLALLVSLLTILTQNTIIPANIVPFLLLAIGLLNAVIAWINGQNPPPTSGVAKFIRR